jgi:transposase-like protein
MSRSTISTYAVFQMFPDQESARLYLESRLWPDSLRCPFCASDRITVRKGGYYRCNACNEGENFTVRTNTVMERSHIPLNKWVYAMYLLVTARKGISSMQLAKEIGVTQKSAWFMLSRLREACGGDDEIDKLRGEVEIDECFVGGLEANKHESKRLRAGRGGVGKTAVLGMRERGEGGRTLAKPISARTLDAIHGEIHGNVEAGSHLYTDDHMVFSDLDGLFYRHETVNHSAGEYRRGNAHTNTIEGYFRSSSAGSMACITMSVPNT